MIGIFDSGVGGLTVVKEIKKALPDASIIYFGDTARLPYGNKSPETIQKYSGEIVDFLVGKGCDTIVIACNSASALAASHLREKYPKLKIFDVVSAGAREAASTTKKKKVGVIGTTATVKSDVYRQKITELEPKIQYFAKACPLFVPLVEESWMKRPETRKIARVYLRELKERQIDTLLLGCTHYPLLRQVIGAVMGKRVKLVDSAQSLAKELKKSYNDDVREQDDEYFVSDLTPHFKSLAALVLGKKIEIKKAKI